MLCITCVRLSLGSTFCKVSRAWYSFDWCHLWADMEYMTSRVPINQLYMPFISKFSPVECPPSRAILGNLAVLQFVGISVSDFLEYLLGCSLQVFQSNCLTCLQTANNFPLLSLFHKGLSLWLLKSDWARISISTRLCTPCSHKPTTTSGYFSPLFRNFICYFQKNYVGSSRT